MFSSIMLDPFLEHVVSWWLGGWDSVGHSKMSEDFYPVLENCRCTCPRIHDHLMRSEDNWHFLREQEHVSLTIS